MRLPSREIPLYTDGMSPEEHALAQVMAARYQEREAEAIAELYRFVDTSVSSEPCIDMKRGPDGTYGPSGIVGK